MLDGFKDASKKSGKSMRGSQGDDATCQLANNIQFKEITCFKKILVMIG